MLTLTKHADKVQFLTNFLDGNLEAFDNRRPLMLLGSGANGKSYTIMEVVKNSPVNIVLFYPGDGYRFYPATKPSDECVILIHANGAPQEFAFANALGAEIVEFAQDPAYVS